MDEQNRTKHEKQSSSIWIGLIFIVGGITVLLNQFDLLPFELNWWALFILLPAFGFLSGAYNRYRSHGEAFSMDVAITALIGLFMLGLSFSLLVGAAWNFNWNLVWPLILILIGLGMVFGRARRE